jgi:hypothetical protein
MGLYLVSLYLGVWVYYQGLRLKLELIVHKSFGYFAQVDYNSIGWIFSNFIIHHHGHY